MISCAEKREEERGEKSFSSEPEREEETVETLEESIDLVQGEEEEDSSPFNNLLLVNFAFNSAINASVTSVKKNLFFLQWLVRLFFLGGSNTHYMLAKTLF